MQDVTAAIILDKDKVLIARRAPGEKHAGWWEFPGGKLELDETSEECLSRELMEEFGIDSRIGEKFAESIYEYEAGSVRLLAYHAAITGGSLTLHVHDEVQWVRFPELNRYMLLPADCPIAMKLQETPPV